MSEAPEITPAPAPKRHTLLFISIGIVLLLVLVYVGGNFVLPASLMASYQGKNCALALSLNSTYTSLYPAAMIDKNIAAPVQECALYSLAGSSEESKAWQDSYNAYKSYADTYPKGLFSKEAYEHSAVVLVAWSKDLLAQKNYAQSVAQLELLFHSYPDSAAALQANGLMAGAYHAWGADLRASSDFAGAEKTLKTYLAWSQGISHVEDIKSAQRELAQTYLEWAAALQGHKQFDDAKAKLELAISTDPEPLAEAGPAAQAKLAEAKLFAQWGDDFIEKKDFTSAIDRYKTALTLSPAKDQPAATDAISTAYLKWAASLRDGEDFLGALGKVEEAGKTTATDAARTAVENAKSDTYLAFSKSSGAQAQKAMKDAIKNICDNKKKPDLPIFGLDKDKLLAAVYGVDYKLPDSVLAQTPGTLHYVACIGMDTLKIEKKDIPIWTGRGFITGQMVREKYVWHVTLYRADTAEATQKTDLEGGTPPPLPELNRSTFIGIVTGGIYQRYKGTDPDIAALANWLLTVMK